MNEFTITLDEYELAHLLWMLNDAKDSHYHNGDWYMQITSKLANLVTASGVDYLTNNGVVVNKEFVEDMWKN